MHLRNAVLLTAAICLTLFAAEDVANHSAAPVRQEGSLEPVARRTGPTPSGEDAIAPLFSYQGRLTDADGAPIPDDAYEMTFRLYEQATGGTAYWSETQTVAVSNGLFSLLLGSAVPITSVPGSGVLYLGMQVGTEPELHPRLRVGAAAYSFRAQRAEDAASVGGMTLDSLDSRYVFEGKSSSVSTGMLQDGCVNTWKITDGTIARADVAADFRAPFADTADYARAAPASDSARVAGNSYLFAGRPVTDFAPVFHDHHGTYVREGQANSITSDMIEDGAVAPEDISDLAVTTDKLDNEAVTTAKLAIGAVSANHIADGAVTSAKILDGTIAAADWNQMGADSGQVMKWSGSAWVPAEDRTTADRTWIRSGSDSVLYTANALGIVRGGADNVANGENRHTHVNLGTESTTGSGDESHCVIVGGVGNTASGDGSVIGGGGYNVAGGQRAVVAGGEANRAYGRHATVSGGMFNHALGWGAAIPGGHENWCDGDHCLAANSFSIADGYNSAAFNGTHTFGSNQLSCGVLIEYVGLFRIDDPSDPTGQMLSQYSVNSPEMLLIYRGEAALDDAGRAEVTLPDYFDALSERPMVQLTGVGTSDVFVAEKVSGNRFVIGGRPGAEVYWTVTGARSDQSARIAGMLNPVRQPKTGKLAGRSLDDDFLVGVKREMDRLGYGAQFDFRTAEGRARLAKLAASTPNSSATPDKEGR